MTDLNFKFLELPNNMLNMDPNVNNLSIYIKTSSCQLYFPCVKAGILKTVPRAASSSSIKKLRSTKMQSPCESICKKSEFNVIILSEAGPPHL